MRHQKLFKVICAATIACQLAACSSTRVQLSAEPDDARIYVDGASMGTGQVSVDVGPEYGYPRNLLVSIKRSGYETLETKIQSEPDWGITAANAATLLTVGLLAGIYGLTSRNYVVAGVGAVDLLLIPLTFFNSHKFRKGYMFELAPLPKPLVPAGS